MKQKRERVPRFWQITCTLSALCVLLLILLVSRRTVTIISIQDLPHPQSADFVIESSVPAAFNTRMLEIREKRVAKNLAERQAKIRRYAISLTNMQLPQEKVNQLYEVTGIYDHPNMTWHTDRDRVIGMDQILESFPFLRQIDGTTDMEAAEAMRRLLQRIIDLAFEIAEMEKANSSGSVQMHALVEQKLGASRAIGQLTHQIIRERTRNLKGLKPSGELLAVSENFSEFDRSRMQTAARHLMFLQDLYERGVASFEEAHARLNALGFIKQAGIVISEEGAHFLLNARLSELMIPDYQYPEDKKAGSP